ncbi:MAG: hypothetical protein ArsCj_4650 [Arsenophonus endosymbiont of Ceratovacuna japonica]
MMNYKITIHHTQDIQIPFYSNKHISILDAIEQSKIQIEFQCRSSFCGICRVILCKGKVRYFCKPIAFIDKNEILTCSCYPITNIDIIYHIINV